MSSVNLLCDWSWHWFEKAYNSIIMHPCSNLKQNLKILYRLQDFFLGQKYFSIRKLNGRVVQKMHVCGGGIKRHFFSLLSPQKVFIVNLDISLFECTSLQKCYTYNTQGCHCWGQLPLMKHNESTEVKFLCLPHR